MKKVGIVTYWEKNYGSALQCYALKSEIEKNGYVCEIMGESFPGVDKYNHYAKELKSIFLISIQHPSYLMKYIMLRKAVKYSTNCLSKESDLRLNLFCESVLQPRKYSYGHMKKLALEDKYKCFIAGSDQIWSGNQKMNNVFFLKFAPPEKRIAFAPSFGTENIDSFNIRSFKREIRKFKKLSVREQRGQEIVKELTGLDVPRIADPTFLKTREEWTEFAKESQLLNGKYILVHFLDEPNDTVIQCLRNLSSETGYRTISFAYPHSVFQSISNYQFVDGDPRDYVALIEHAEYVLTDSFHTTLFSVIFGRKFFTFVRQYRHSRSQQSRITTLLELVEYNDRFIQTIEGFKAELNAELHSCDTILEREREKAKNYLTDAIGFEIGEKTEDIALNRAKKVTLATEETCTGCLACYSACEKGAIRIETSTFGFEVPKIDLELCVNCGKCQSVCAVINKFEFLKSNHDTEGYKRTAYVAYNNDSDLRSMAASGGTFASLASSFLKSGGVVFGARLSFKKGKPIVEHIPVYSLEELPAIFQSKYVQSDASSAYPQIKKLLQDSKRVLFCGTSCQVDALYHFLNNNIKEQYGENLFTVDLICHGVPGRKFFQDYVALREKKNKALINNFTFRTKDNLKKQIVYQETLTMFSDRKKNLCIPANKSSYYRLFLGEESYRDACYECRYASINKPADITIGDYFELKDDYPELYAKLSESSVWDINSVIVHSFQGEKLLQLAKKSIVTFSVDIRRVQASHKQLCKPSHYTLERERVMEIYRKKGFAGIDSYYRNRDRLLYLPIKIKRMLSR